ncbi:MAG: redox-regulated ATPase YchF [Phycisphaerae bacterium]
MRVALIGPPQSGKSTLFAAVAEASGSGVDLSRPDQPHLAVVKVPDERLTWLSELYQPKKTTPAELEFLDLPGFDLTDEAGRSRAKQHWAAMRQSDMIVLVVRAFEDPSAAPYRDRIEPEADVEEFLSELMFADLDQVTNRIEKLQVQVKKPTRDREEHLRELDLMERIQETLENEQPVSQAVQSEAEDKLIRSFAFLSQKPLLVVRNVDEDKLSEPAPKEIHGVDCLTLSAKIEEEIAQLPPEDRSEFMADLGIDESARDRLIQACYAELNLVSFLTVGEDECRAWTIFAGTPAVEAAGEIHSDIQRGFIRAETVAYEDLRAAGNMKDAKAAGNVRLEGKTYLVQDGDIINFRFNV